MKTVEEYINENIVKYSDNDTSEWASSVQPVIKLLESKGHPVVALVGAGIQDFIIGELNSFDKKQYKGTKLKSGVKLYRYATEKTLIGKLMPVVGVNITKGLIYFNKPEASENDVIDLDKSIGFRAKYIRRVEK